jgi:hypothetical protein
VSGVSKRKGSVQIGPNMRPARAKINFVIGMVVFVILAVITIAIENAHHIKIH